MPPIPAVIRININDTFFMHYAGAIPMFYGKLSSWCNVRNNSIRFCPLPRHSVNAGISNTIIGGSESKTPNFTVKSDNQQRAWCCSFTRHFVAAVGCGLPPR